MPERRFSCQKSDNLYDPGYNSVSLEAEALFNRMQLCSDRFGELSADPRVILGECLAMRIGTDAVSLEKVIEWLAQLERAGNIQYAQGRKGPYIRIAERLRYRRSDCKLPRWSDTLETGFDDQQGDEPPPEEEEQYEQTEMAIPVVHSVKPMHPLEAENIRKKGKDSKRKKDNESTRARGKKPVPKPPAPAGNDSETRAGSAGIPEGSGEAPSKQIPPRSPEVNRFIFELGELVDANEIWTNSGLWIERYNHAPLAMAGALSDLKNRINNRNEKPLENEAAWLTKRFFELAPPIRRAA